MRRPIALTLSLVALLLMASCQGRGSTGAAPPWASSDTAASAGFDLADIQANGELIMLTLSGPDTYYDYHGSPLGAHYMLCRRFADHIGVRLRVEVCRDTAALLHNILAGNADIIACPLPVSVMAEGITKCGVGSDSIGWWATAADKPRLAEVLNAWYQPALLQQVRAEERGVLSQEGSVRRRVYAPMKDKRRGVISDYDDLFRTYSQSIRWDWRLMAAQCYQESTFDPDARSFAGALGLMQIMPATARHLGLDIGLIHDPESNISAAARFIGELERTFADIPSREERINFILAAYNCGPLHLRDAMALTQKYGKNPKQWTDVAPFVKALSQPQYYNDPVVKNGYMRGSETVDYVDKILQRWRGYRSVASPRVGTSKGGFSPKKSSSHKYEL